MKRQQYPLEVFLRSCSPSLFAQPQTCNAGEWLACLGFPLPTALHGVPLGEVLGTP